MRGLKHTLWLFALLVLVTGAISLALLSVNAQKDNDNCSPEKENFKICVESKQPARKIGEDVKISILVWNLSEEERLSSNSGYEFKVVGETGENIPTIFEKRLIELGHSTEETKDSWKIDFSSRGSRRTSFNSHESQIEQLNLSKVYDFSTIGKYTVSIKRKIPSKDGNGFIELVIDKIEIEIK
jgi:hypothetical protein